MAIDSVKEIIQIPPDKIDYETKDNSCIKGSALHEENLIILLDIASDNVYSNMDN